MKNFPYLDEILENALKKRKVKNPSLSWTQKQINEIVKIVEQSNENDVSIEMVARLVKERIG